MSQTTQVLLTQVKKADPPKKRPKKGKKKSTADYPL